MQWMQTNGLFPTQFDRTTNAVLRTAQSLGTSPEELEADRVFLVSVMAAIGNPHPDQIPFDATIELLDCAYIGLVYHRHVPFMDEDTGQMRMAHGGNITAYTDTLAMLSEALVNQAGITPDQIIGCATEAAEVTAQHLDPPDSRDDEGLRLHMDFIGMVIIGLLVHRFGPEETHDQP